MTSSISISHCCRMLAAFSTAKRTLQPVCDSAAETYVAFWHVMPNRYTTATTLPPAAYKRTPSNLHRAMHYYLVRSLTILCQSQSILPNLIHNVLPYFEPTVCQNMYQLANCMTCMLLTCQLTPQPVTPSQIVYTCT
jgi:hypothetical protein